ncbi:xanthine dehydrogenase family protein subunit M [bacterium]|nr:xanthine dehydrogenase family protein subunit M [bacterium]
MAGLRTGRGPGHEDVDPAVLRKVIVMADPAYCRPERIEEVAALLVETGGRPLAGATDLLVQMRGRDASTFSFVDINGLGSLGEVTALPDGGVVIGATVRLSDLRTHPLCYPYPALLEGAASVGSVQVRNRATLVGNACNASPAADTAPGLLVYEATANVVGPAGRRSIAFEDFWLGPGQTALGHGEWVESITFPPPARHGGAYLKLGRTNGVDLAIVGVALYRTDVETRVAFASVAPTPIRARSLDELIGGAARLPANLSGAVGEAIAPIDDLRASARYRTAMAVVLVERAWALAGDRLAEENAGSR